MQKPCRFRKFPIFSTEAQPGQPPGELGIILWLRASQDPWDSGFPPGPHTTPHSSGSKLGFASADSCTWSHISCRTRTKAGQRLSMVAGEGWGQQCIHILKSHLFSSLPVKLCWLGLVTPGRIVSGSLLLGPLPNLLWNLIFFQCTNENVNSAKWTSVRNDGFSDHHGWSS